MSDPITLVESIKKAAEVAETPFFKTIFDRLTGFRLSKWVAEGEVRKKVIHDDYEKAKEAGIIGMQYIEYMRRTENLLNTAVKSSNYIDPYKPNDIRMDNDFFWNTIEHAKTVSSDEVQELIAKIIASEYNVPGTYSMSTLQTLKMLGKNELELFERHCTLCINDTQIPQEVFTKNESLEDLLSFLGVDFSTFQSLQILGLYLPNQMTGTLKTVNAKRLKVNYFDRDIIFERKLEFKGEISLPSYYELSTTGIQIIKHLNPKQIDEYFEWLKCNYKIPYYEMIDD